MPHCHCQLIGPVYQVLINLELTLVEENKKKGMQLHNIASFFFEICRAINPSFLFSLQSLQLQDTFPHY